MRYFKAFQHLLESLFRGLFVLEFMNTLLFASALEKLTWQNWLLAYAGCTVLAALLLLLRKRLTLLPYSLLAILCLVGLFLFSGISLLVKIFICVTLVVGALKPIAHFEKVYLVLPVFFFILHGVENDNFGKILDLFFSLNLVVIALTWNFAASFSQGELLGKSTFYFSEKKYVLESFRLFKKQLLVLVSLCSILIVGVIFTKPFATFSGFTPSTPTEEKTFTSATSEIFTSNAGKKQPAFTLNKLGKENKVMRDFWKALEKGLIIIFWGIIGGGVIAFVLYGSYLLYRQLKGVKKEVPTDLLENSDIVLNLGEKKKTTGFSFLGTPQSRLRQKYRRLFKKKPPKVSSTPQEQLTKVDYTLETKEALQKLYEKARYSEKEITKEDYQKFKELSRQKRD